MTTLREVMDRVKEFPDRKAFQEKVMSVIWAETGDSLPEPFNDAMDGSEHPDIAGDFWDKAHAPAAPAPAADAAPSGCTQEPYRYDLDLAGEAIAVAGISREEFVQNYSAAFRNRYLLKQSLPQELTGMRPENFGIVGGKIWDKAHGLAPEAAPASAGQGAAAETPNEGGTYAAQAKKNAKDG